MGCDARKNLAEFWKISLLLSFLPILDSCSSNFFPFFLMHFLRQKKRYGGFLVFIAGETAPPVVLYLAPSWELFHLNIKIHIFTTSNTPSLTFVKKESGIVMNFTVRF